MNSEDTAPHLPPGATSSPRVGGAECSLGCHWKLPVTGHTAEDVRWVTFQAVRLDLELRFTSRCLLVMCFGVFSRA